MLTSAKVASALELYRGLLTKHQYSFAEHKKERTIVELKEKLCDSCRCPKWMHRRTESNIKRHVVARLGASWLKLNFNQRQFISNEVKQFMQSQPKGVINEKE